MNRWVFGVLFLLATVGLAVGGSQYAITVDDGIDTPNKEVHLEGNTFTVRGIADITPGETLTASVDVPDDNDGYRVYIYGTIDGKREIIDSKYSTTGTSVTFDTTGYAPGTYTLALHTDGDYQAVYPFIITGATSDLTTPETATVGDEVTIESAVSPTESQIDIAGVEFVIYGNGESHRITGTATDSGYSASFDTSALSTGEYTVYAVVQNASETPQGDPEPIGLSSQATLTIEAESSDSDSQQTTTTTTATTTQQSETTTKQPSTTKTPTTTLPATTTRAGTPTTAITSTTTAPTETTAAMTTDNVIDPNPSTTTSTSAPGPSLGASVAVVVFAILLTRRRE